MVSGKPNPSHSQDHGPSSHVEHHEKASGRKEEDRAEAGDKKDKDGDDGQEKDREPRQKREEFCDQHPSEASCVATSDLVRQDDIVPILIPIVTRK